MSETFPPARNGLRTLAAVAGGGALSFLGVGLLWIGTRSIFQMLMFFPFFFLSRALTRADSPGENTLIPIIAAASPLGYMVTLFRDKNDSHLMSVLTVCCWLAGALAGKYLRKR